MSGEPTRGERVRAMIALVRAYKNADAAAAEQLLDDIEREYGRALDGDAVAAALPRLERIGVAAKRLGMAAEALRGNIPGTALYRVNRNLLVDVDAAADWLASKCRVDPEQSALRRDFVRQAGRGSGGALRRDFLRGRP